MAQFVVSKIQILQKNAKIQFGLQKKQCKNLQKGDRFKVWSVVLEKL